MSEFISIHPDNPQPRLINKAVKSVRNGGVIIYPTDSGYAIGCHLGDKKALERICAIRDIDSKHNFTLLCRDLSEIANYAQVDNESYRRLKASTPGPYTFIFKASKEVPKRLQNKKKKTIGIRVPDHPISLAILEELGEPLMTASLILPEEDLPLFDPYHIQDLLENRVDLIVDGGETPQIPTTVVDLSTGIPEILRVGAGDCAGFE